MADAGFDAAVGRAASLLGASRFPVVAGLQTDLAGIAAAIRLAKKLGGAVDHAAAEASLADAAVLHDTGMMLVSPGEARRRADTILIVGDGPMRAWPDLVEYLDAQGSARLTGTPRRILTLTEDGLAGLDPAAGSTSMPQQEFAASRMDRSGIDAGRGGVPPPWCAGRAPSSMRGASVASLLGGIPGLIGALRARVNARPVAGGGFPELDRVAALLKAAKYGVAVWSPGEIDGLAIEMLVGLLKDLNAETRWAGLSVTEDLSAVAAAMAAGWMTGFPLRTGFGRGLAEHDPWRFDSRRMVESGEADAIVWISTLGDPVPDWVAGVTAVTVTDRPARQSGEIALIVGRPGADHDGIFYDRRTGTLVQHVAASASSVPSAAEALNRIAESLPA